MLVYILKFLVLSGGGGVCVCGGGWGVIYAAFKKSGISA